MEFTRTTGEQRRLEFLANEVVLHVPGAATGGTYCLAEFEGPRGDMPPAELAAGDSLVAPRGTPHTYRVESDRARWLVVCSPAGFDDFVREVASAGERIEPPALAEKAFANQVELTQTKWYRLKTLAGEAFTPARIVATGALTGLAVGFTAPWARIGGTIRIVELGTSIANLVGAMQAQAAAEEASDVTRHGSLSLEEVEIFAGPIDEL